MQNLNFTDNLFEINNDWNSKLTPDTVTHSEPVPKPKNPRRQPPENFL